MNKKLAKMQRVRAREEALQTDEQRRRELARIEKGKPVARRETVSNSPKKDRKSIPDPHIILKTLRELSVQVSSLNDQIRELTKYYGGQIEDLKDKKTQKAQISWIG